MLIGLTYDLRSDYLAAGYSEQETAEFDSPATIAALRHALTQAGHDVEPIGNIFSLVEALAAGKRWNLVFNIAEGLTGLAREAQTPALLEAYGIPCTFADPLVLALCLHKGLTKTMVQAAGLPTPPFALVQHDRDIEKIDLPFPLFAKPVAEGTSKGVTAASKLRDRDALNSVCRELLAQFHQGVLVESFLPGREFTVGVLGSGEKARVLGTLEIVLRSSAEPEVYSYANKELCEQHVDYHLVCPLNDPEVRRAEDIALAAYRALGCRDAGRVDVRSDAQGEPNFIEINPLAGLNPVHSDLPILCGKLGIPYQRLIEEIVASAHERVSNQPRKLPREAIAV